ncbi:YcjF family protein [Photobacterium lipolyticum]|uniref:Kinase n=1 Tax=Photobacterium lipolyticum TaxID=266810 RepID=A0A2T3MUY4_9GAMM|nr:GTPase [Photobacterium lipolyticum]PSW03780.1 kinase [Photobacterium lipolyticum]
MNSFKKIFDYINPSVNPDLEPAFTQWQEQLPTLWLLGKTGAGKSSLVQALTGDSQVEIGNGFLPCTKTAVSYDYPVNNPLLRFLDTRGVSETDYDPAEDTQICQQRSHALIVVMKAEEPEQSGVINALKKIKKFGVIKQLLIVHTAVLSIADIAERERAMAHNQSQVEAVWGRTAPTVAADFAPSDAAPVSADDARIGESGLHELKNKLAEMLPILSLLTNKQAHASREESNFEKLRSEVLWYAGAAGASDAIPAVGLVSVPAIQGKMLHSLANQYAVVWDKQCFMEFIGTLGTGFMVQYLSKLGIRQLVKFIPAYGQTVGGATAAAISFSSTYAIGRAACKYLYHKSKGETVTKEEMKAIFEQAIKAVAKIEAGSSGKQKKNETDKK